MSRNTIIAFAFLSFAIILAVSFKGIKLDKTTLKDMATPLNKTYKINNLKKQTIINQGIQEEITTKTYHSNLGYKIDFDVNLFKPLRTKGLDKFIFISDEEVYFTIEKINDKEFNLGKNTQNLLYKKFDNLYLKIKIYCSEDPDYEFGIYNKIIYLVDNIKAE